MASTNRAAQRYTRAVPAPEDTIELPAPLRHLRRYALDGALLLFDRDTGLHALCDGPETGHLRRRTPRVVQFAITNRCNLACAFCSRDASDASLWTADEAFALLADLAAAGTLEVAFGGGEPWAFRGIEALVARLHEQTPLAVNLTTNGTLITRASLDAMRGRYGQIRLSLYEDNHWPRTVELLVEAGARFGANWLVTPSRLPIVEARVIDLVERGCRDVLLLSYNGEDRALHLTAAQSADLAMRVRALASALRGRCQLKLSVCWGERMEPVPQLLAGADCGAGVDFVVVTSEKRLMPCSFHQVTRPAATAAQVLAAWQHERAALSGPAHAPGCARRAGNGLGA